MIQYYNTEAEYNAAVLSAFESQVSLVGADNSVKFDGRNVVVDVRAALTGSVVVLDGNSALHFIARNTYSSASFMSNFTIIGVVLVGIDHKDFRGKIMIGHKTGATKKWSEIYSFKLTGYTLDGTDRTGTLKVYSAASTFDNYVVSYNADTVEDFVDQLNAFFQDTTNTVFQTQHWRADADGDGNVTLSFLFTFGDQRSCAGSAGFTLTANLLPEIVASSAMLRYNGQRSGEGTVLNMPRALAYFRADLNNATYNPTTTQTAANAKRSYPICLPGYLGTSQYSGGADRCAAIREIYGQGEAGWLKFMESFYPVKPTAYGPMGDKKTYGDGMKNTYIMAGRKFTKQDGSEIIAYPAADFCANISYNHDALRKGNWHLADIDELASYLSTIKYNAVNDRKADVINEALLAIGGEAISNGAYAWSSSRSYAGFAWCFLGYYGCASINSLCYAYRALPVLLLDVSEGLADA